MPEKTVQIVENIRMNDIVENSMQMEDFNDCVVKLKNDGETSLGGQFTSMLKL